MCTSTDSIDPFVTGNSSRLTSVASEAWAGKFSETGVETETCEQRLAERI